MNGLLHIVIGSPDSARLHTLGQAFETSDLDSAFYLLPEELTPSDLPFCLWTWRHDSYVFETPVDRVPNEWFLFFSNQVNVADQIEGLIRLLETKEELLLGRILLFVNANYLSKDKEITDWMDGCAHFADAICIFNRDNKNGVRVNYFTERYKSLHFPLEIFLLKKQKLASLSKILSSSTRRMSHVFDPLDLLEPDESPQNDPYLERLKNGNRKLPIPMPFLKN